MAFVGVSQYNHHNQQIDEYEYDDTDNFYDDGPNFGNYLDVDDSEGKRERERKRAEQVFAWCKKFNRNNILNHFYVNCFLGSRYRRSQ